MSAFFCCCRNAKCVFVVFIFYFVHSGLVWLGVVNGGMVGVTAYVFFLLMEPIDIPILDGPPIDGNLMEIGNVGTCNAEDDTADIERITHHIDNMITKVVELEQKVNEVEQFFLTSSKRINFKGSSVVKDKDKDKHIINIKKQQQDATQREAASAKRMQELMRQLSTILRQAITRPLYLFS
ncbi:PREDICTED: transcription factor GTE6-like isoform X1 [Nelumbo nucifera]|uniref:Transcription factor GTE6-like isoform X1 n=2 Tax=Nelumbo nucifera TaxID=4432 RepID=A0A1U7ZAQ9_NELNU|nr:PREDICTED: transcription factor GTE6-like isoform X1 [Nelumbo nucifera]